MTEIFEQSSRCLHCKNPLCKTGCPISYDIPEFLRLAKSGDFSSATETVGHLFGEVCGYICPHDIQCRGHCVLGKRGEAVDIGAVERMVFAECFPTLRKKSDELSCLKVAVVGGGVSGIAFAAECYAKSADVTVFERRELLSTLKSIPNFRLPQSAIDKIVDAVHQSDIKVVKKDIDAEALAQMRKQFDVVYLATGVTLPHKMRVDGEQYATIADDFLRGNTFGDAIVVGGGNTAMDCARLNARHGCKTLVAYRRTRADMPAFNREVSDAFAENVEFRFNLAPVLVEKRNDKLAVTFAETVSEGRGKLVLTDKLQTCVCDILVLALGNGYDGSVFAAERFVPIDENNCVCGNLFAGGDATGKSLAAQAVADGLRAAKAVSAMYRPISG